MVSVTNLGAVRSARGKLAALEPALTGRRISAIVRGYLGKHTMLHGYKVTELNKPVGQQGDGASSYISSLCACPSCLSPPLSRRAVTNDRRTDQQAPEFALS